MIKRLIDILSLMTIATLCLSACGDDEEFSTVASNSSAPANLCITIGAPEASITTRSKENVSKYYNDITEWDDWDKAVDGRFIYRLTLLLINKDNSLVAYRDLYKGSADIQTASSLNGANGFINANGVVDDIDNSTEAKITFANNSPLHAGENLTEGDYTLMVVANWSDYTYSTNSYSGLTGFSPFISAIKNNFNGGIDDFTASNSNYSGMFNYKLTAGDDYLAPLVPQPLTLVKQIHLNAGDNQISAELIRTYARIRIEVENNSDTQPLTVSDLDFCDYIAQKEEYLFKEDFSLTTSKINAESDNAITPFITQTIDAQKTNVIFDGYVLESGDTEDYWYNIDVEYASVENDTYSFITDTPIKTVSELAEWHNKTHYFAMRNWNSEQRFLYSGDNTVEAANVELIDIQNSFSDINNKKKYIWELEKNTGDNQYYIKSMMNGKYMQNPTDSKMGLGDKNVYFTATSGINSFTCFKSSGGVNYINVYGHNQEIVAGWNDNDAGSEFYLYPISTGLRYNNDITLETIDPETNALSPVTNICRNDFINILVTVSYSENSGYFNFEVKPYGSVNGDLTFE